MKLVRSVFVWSTVLTSSTALIVDHQVPRRPIRRQVLRSQQRSRSSAMHLLQTGDEEHVLDKMQRLVTQATPINPEFDQNLKSIFPEALDNNNLEMRVVQMLHERGLTADNTLLATSLCSDELAVQFANDFGKIYGQGFNLGGLAGFPFAGNIGFETLSGHIPDDGFCFIVYGPHVGVTQDGTIGKVERQGVTLVDDCCRSAVEAYNKVVHGSSSDDSSDGDDPLAFFTDFQQNAVHNLVQPLHGRLSQSQWPMLDLPYILFERQNELLQEIVYNGVSEVKQGLVLLGGVQINSGPDTPDYFHPLRFECINNQGEIVEDMLPTLLYG